MPTVFEILHGKPFVLAAIAEWYNDNGAAKLQRKNARKDAYSYSSNRGATANRKTLGCLAVVVRYTCVKDG